MLPTARFVIYVYTLKITQYVRQLGVPLLLFLHVQPTITGVALCRENV